VRNKRKPLLNLRYQQWESLVLFRLLNQWSWDSKMRPSDRWMLNRQCQEEISDGLMMEIPFVGRYIFRNLLRNDKEKIVTACESINYKKWFCAVLSLKETDVRPLGLWKKIAAVIINFENLFVDEQYDRHFGSTNNDWDFIFLVSHCYEVNDERDGLAR